MLFKQKPKPVAPELEERFTYLLTDSVSIAGCEGARPRSLEYEGDEVEVGIEDAKYIESHRHGIPLKGQRSAHGELPTLGPMGSLEGYQAMIAAASKRTTLPQKPKPIVFRVRMLTTHRLLSKYPDYKRGKIFETESGSLAFDLVNSKDAEWVDGDPNANAPLGVVRADPPRPAANPGPAVEVPRRK
jgi:hypothetical protein